MNTYKLIGYLDNNLANTFLIPIFSNENQYFFQTISPDNNTIHSFDNVNDTSIAEQLRHCNYKNPNKTINDVSIYLYRLNVEIFIGSKTEILENLKKIYEQFNPSTNLFFMRDLMTLFDKEISNCIKYFFHLNFIKYEEFDELIFYMSIIFSKSEDAISKEIDKIRLRPYVYGRKSAKEFIKERQKMAKEKKKLLHFIEAKLKFDDDNDDNDNREYYFLE